MKALTCESAGGSLDTYDPTAGNSRKRCFDASFCFVRPVRSFVRLFVRLCLRSSVPSFVRFFPRSFLRSVARSFVRLFVCAFVRSFVRSCVRSQNKSAPPRTPHTRKKQKCCREGAHSRIWGASGHSGGIGADGVPIVLHSYNATHSPMEER